MAEDKAQGALEMLRWQLKGTNINGQTLLATDYLNHFNELIMFIEMIPDMPDMLADARAWTPKTYIQHFLDSGFRDKAWAILAYELAPRVYKDPFDKAVNAMNDLVPLGLDSIEFAIASGDQDRIAETVGRVTRNLRSLQDAAAANINGSAAPLSQDKIDDLLSAVMASGPPEGTGSGRASGAAVAPGGMNQSAVDSLFD